MELFGDLLISGAIVVANALYSVLAIALALRKPWLFRWVRATSILAISCFALNEGLLILQSVGMGQVQSWITVPLMTMTVLLTPPAVSSIVIGRLLRVRPSMSIVWAFSAAAGILVGMFLYFQLIWLEDNGMQVSKRLANTCLQTDHASPLSLLGGGRVKKLLFRLANPELEGSRSGLSVVCVKNSNSPKFRLTCSPWCERPVAAEAQTVRRLRAPDHDSPGENSLELRPPSFGSLPRYLLLPVAPVCSFPRATVIGGLR